MQWAGQTAYGVSDEMQTERYAALEKEIEARRIKRLVRHAATWEKFLGGWYFVQDEQGKAFWVSPRGLVLESERNR